MPPAVLMAGPTPARPQRAADGRSDRISIVGGMERGGNRDAPGDEPGHPHDGDPGHPPGVGLGHPPGGGPDHSGQRSWTHPSEIGLQTRVHTDRRRGRALVAGLIALGVAVLVGTAGLATAISGPDRPVNDASAQEPLSGCLALVDMAGPQGTAQATGLLVDHGRHVVVAADGVDTVAEVTVRIGDQSTPGRVVAHDSYLDLALIELGDRIGSPPEMSKASSVGDPLRIVLFDPAGHRRSSQVRVERMAATWSRPDHTIAKDVLTLSGDAAHTGVLVDPAGAVAGLVIGTTGEHSVAYDSDVLSSLVAKLLAGGDADHPWIGVRARDLGPVPGANTTVVSATGPAVPDGGAHVIEVLSGSPAEEAGITADDIITALGNRSVTDMADLAAAVSELSPGDTVTVSGVRDGKMISLTVRVGAFPG